MKYLAYCISIACFLPVAKAGQINISPTVELGVHSGSVKSPNENLDRDGLVYSSKISTDIKYETKKTTSSLNYKWTKYKYNDELSNDSDYQDFKLSTSIDVWRDDLVFKFSINRYHDLLDVIQGNFSDEIYDEETQVKKTRRIYTAKYVLPDVHDFDLNLTLDHEGNSASSKNDFRSVDFSEGYEVKRAFLNFGDFEKTKSLYWKFTAELEDQKRQSLSSTTERDYDAIVRFPLIPNVRLVGTASSSEFSTSNINFSDSTNEQKTETLGVGLAWVRDQDGSYLQATINTNQETNERTVGAEISWKVADKIRLEYSREEEFFGRRNTASIDYFGDKNRFSFNLLEGVDYRYATVVRQENLGFYICSSDENGDFEFDENLCYLPESGNQEIGQGEALLPNIVTTFPIEVRLSKERRYSASWSFESGNWTHSVSASKTTQRDLDRELEEESSFASFHGEQRLNQKSYVSFDWKFRDIEINREQAKSSEVLYSTGYHYELNTRAEWSLKAQFINKKTPNNSFDYEEARLSFNYKHHFGDKHRERRTF